MWIVVGKKTRVKVVPGGRVIEQHCAECNGLRRFVECDVADKLSLFFVPLVDLKTRRMVCMECGDDREVPATKVSAKPAATKPPQPQATEEDLDKMLADLKRKMEGRDDTTPSNSQRPSFWNRFGWKK